jgi:hypothetical protein
MYFSKTSEFILDKIQFKKEEAETLDEEEWEEDEEEEDDDEDFSGDEEDDDCTESIQDEEVTKQTTQKSATLANIDGLTVQPYMKIETLGAFMSQDGVEVTVVSGGKECLVAYRTSGDDRLLFHVVGEKKYTEGSIFDVKALETNIPAKKGLKLKDLVKNPEITNLKLTDEYGILSIKDKTFPQKEFISHVTFDVDFWRMKNMIAAGVFMDFSGRNKGYVHFNSEKDRPTLHYFYRWKENGALDITGLHEEGLPRDFTTTTRTFDQFVREQKEQGDESPRNVPFYMMDRQKKPILVDLYMDRF